MKFSRVVLALCVIFTGFGVLAAQTVPGPRRIIVTLRGNAVIVGNLIRLDPDKLEMVGENSIRIIDVDDIVSITFDQGQGNSAKASHNNGADAMLLKKDEPAPTQEKGAPQTIPPDPAHVPRGYGKNHDRPSRRGSREASRKLAEATGEKNETTTGGENNQDPAALNDNNPGNNVKINPPEPDEAALAAERAETERLARLRAERLARERVNRERAAREKAAREKRERAAKAEMERKLKAERAEREKKEKAEKTRKEKDNKNTKAKNSRENEKVKTKETKEKKPETRKKGKK